MELNHRHIRSFVLRSGRISKTQEYALEHYMPLYAAELSDGYLDFPGLFKKDQPVVVEIGFGMGRATLELAERFPETNYLGIEVYKPGVGRVLSEIHTKGLGNLRIMRADATEVVQRMLKEGSIHGFHIFFPDPWPKKKHHKRRLFQRDFVDLLARKLEPGGYIYAVTDWEEYAEQMLEVVEAQDLLHNPFGGFAPPQPWRPATSFEHKGREKSHCISEIWAEKTG